MRDKIYDDLNYKFELYKKGKKYKEITNISSIHS